MKTITLCSSMAFYKELLSIGEKLEKMNFHVLYPESSLIMKKSNNFSPSVFKNSYTDAERGKFIKLHFQKVTKSNAILVINKTKKGIKGYVGGNTLMEMGIAFGANIKIYLLHPVSKNNSFYEEIVAMSPIILKGKIDTIKL